MSDFWVYPLGTALGSERVDVESLITEHGPVRDGFLERTGFTHVYRAGETETSLSLAITAAGGTDEQWWTATVDGLISVGSTGTLVAPGNAHLLQTALGLRNDVLVLDLNDACTGFVRSLHLASSLLSSGAASAILLILSDTYSKLYAPSDLKVSPLFSDGASAMIISATRLENVPASVSPRRWRVLASSFISDGGKANQLSISRTDNANCALGELEMNGAGVFNFVLGNLNKTLDRLNAASGLSPNEVTTWFVHQGSRAVVTAVEKALGSPAGALFRAGEYGNTVGSSIPFQLFDDPTPDKAETVGLLAFGVGLTMGGLVIEQQESRDER